MVHPYMVRISVFYKAVKHHMDRVEGHITKKFGKQ